MANGQDLSCSSIGLGFEWRMQGQFSLSMVGGIMVGHLGKYYKKFSAIENDLLCR